jgi:hypothetical protein
MSFLKLNIAVLAVSVMLAAGSQIAQAETIYLTCSDNFGTNKYTIDLTNNTVNDSYDTYKADITATNITWSLTSASNAQGVSDSQYHNIDRTTGIDTFNLTWHMSDGTDRPAAPRNIPCTVSKTAPVTKF